MTTAPAETTEYHRGKSAPDLVLKHRADIARLLRLDDAMPFSEIGRQLGLSRERVRQLAPIQVIERRRRNAEERARRVVELRQENHTLEEIALELDMSTTTVQFHLRQAGLMGVPISRSRAPEMCMVGLHNLNQETYRDEAGRHRPNYYITSDNFRRCARCVLDAGKRQRQAQPKPPPPLRTNKCPLGLHDLRRKTYIFEYKDKDGVVHKESRQNYYIDRGKYRRCARCVLARQRADYAKHKK